MPLKKTEKDVRLLERFLKRRDEDRKIEDIPAAELNEFISEFIISVRTKDGNEYKPTSLWSFNGQLWTAFEEKGLFCQHNKRLFFEKTRKVLQSKQKPLKKQGKGNKPKASVALTSEELKRCTRRVCSFCVVWDTFKHALVKQHSLLWTPWVQRTSWYMLGRFKASQNSKRSGILGVQWKTNEN